MQWDGLHISLFVLMPPEGAVVRRAVRAAKPGHVAFLEVRVFFLGPGKIYDS